MKPSRQKPEACFEDLALQYAEPLFRLAFARIGNAADAEDIVQETYLKAFKNFPSFRHETSIKNWLSKILLNSIRDYFRKSGRMPETVELTDAHELEESLAEPGLDQDNCNFETHPQLMKALAALPEQLLAPLLLREIDDASYEEIALILDVPKGTVMSRLFRARSLLRKTLCNTLDAENTPQSAPNKM